VEDQKAIRSYFWGYDIFGYLLPGAIVALVATKTNTWVYEQVVGHWHSEEATFGIYFIDFIVLLFFVYILGHIISGISSLLLERWILRNTLNYPTSRMFQDGNEPEVSRIRDILFPGYFRAYSTSFQESFYEKFEKKFQSLNRDTHDLFWVSFSYISQHHPVAYKRATHFLELYGFSRNMSMSFILIALLPIIPFWSDEFISGWTLSITSVLIAILMFINYTKLLRRLNDEVFRAFYVSS
jgi:hypothetical protein